jgi:hypothetical protein
MSKGYDLGGGRGGGLGQNGPGVIRMQRWKREEREDGPGEGRRKEGGWAAGEERAHGRKRPEGRSLVFLEIRVLVLFLL